MGARKSGRGFGVSCMLIDDVNGHDGNDDDDDNDDDIVVIVVMTGLG